MNVLFLLADQWPHNSFSFFNKAYSTPNIDNLRKVSTSFSNAFTTCPLCSPARGTLLTGLWPNQSGMLDNPAAYSIQPPLKKEINTWLDQAIENNYDTKYIGKWHLGNEELDPCTRQSAPEWKYKDRNYSYFKMQKIYDEETKKLEKGVSPFWGQLDCPKEEIPCFNKAIKGVEFIKNYCKKGKAKPFFLTVSTASPHFPHYLSKKYAIRAEENIDNIELPKNFFDDFKNKPKFHNMAWWPSMDSDNFSIRDWKRLISYTNEHISMCDEAFGLVIDELKTQGLFDDTLIIFAADHGDMPAAHNRFDKGAYFYEEVWRIPLIIKEKGSTKSDLNSNYVNLLDLNETFFSVIDKKSNTDKRRNGRSLLKKYMSIYQWPNIIFGTYDWYNGMSFSVRAVKNERYKYVWNPQDIDEFYDLKKDPYELNNLVFNSKYSLLMDEMENHLNNWMIKNKDPLIGNVNKLPSFGSIVNTQRVGP